MKIKCPQCQKVFNAPDTYIGKKVKCLKCNHSFIVNSPIDKQQGKFGTRLFPFILLGLVLLLLISVFFYWFPLGQFFKFSQKNVFVSDSNNVPLIKNTGSVNSLDKQPIEQSVKVERKTEKIEKTAQVLRADISATDESKILPTLYSVLDDKIYINDCATWLQRSLTLNLIALELELHGKTIRNSDEFLTKKDDVVEMIYRSNPDHSLLFSYKEEISDLIQSFDFVFVKREKSTDKAMIPIRFASLEDKPVIMIGSICSDIVFNNVNTLLNTPKKRASAFTQKEVLPELLKKDLFHSIRNTPFEYVGLVYIYGNKNFINKNDIGFPESLCVVISLGNYSSFIKRELSQEEFSKKCFVFLKSEGPNFIKVELTLD